MPTQKELETSRYRLCVMRQKLGITSRLTSKDYEQVKQGAQHIDASKEGLEENIKITSDILDNYWIRRRGEARKWIWLQTVSNLYF